MRISLEVSMYPLTNDYKRHVRSFIEALQSQSAEIEIRVNGMSTQLFGEFDIVMRSFNDALKSAMRKGAPLAFVSKTLGADVSEYTFEPK